MSIIDFHLFADDGPGLLEMNVGKRATLDCLEDSGTIQLGLT